MSWLKNELTKVKTKIKRQTRGENEKILEDIRTWQIRKTDGLDDYHKLLVLVRNSAFYLARCPHFHEESILLWKLAYKGTLPEAEKSSLIRSQLPALCDEIDRHQYTVRVSKEAKAVYFEGHEYTKKRLEKREQALTSVLQSLQDAVRYTDKTEQDYDAFWAGRDEIPLDQPEITAPFYERLLQSVRNFSSWQPVFEKISGAESLAHTLSDYEQSVTEWQQEGKRWQLRCRQYIASETQLAADRRSLSREETEYEHSGAFGRRPVFDFSRRGHRLEKHKQALLEEEDSLEWQYDELQNHYKRLCSCILDAAEELCEYVVVLKDCLEGEQEQNRISGERLEAEYEAAQREINDLEDEYKAAGQVKKQLAAVAEEDMHGF